MPGRENRKAVKLGKRSNPLGDDLHADRFASAREAQDMDEAGDLDGQQHAFMLSAKHTRRVFATAREQLSDVQAEEEESRAYRRLHHQANEEDEEGSGRVDAGLAALLRADANAIRQDDHDEDDEAIQMLDYDDNESVQSEVPAEDMEAMQRVAAGRDVEAMFGIDEEEARLLSQLQPASNVQRRHLAGIILDKIQEQQQQQQAGGGRQQQQQSSGPPPIDPRIARVYTAVGSVLHSYTSGKVPKAFKVLPNILNWEELIMLTKPDRWSPHAVYQATRIFSSNLNEAMAQRFYAAILLPIIHERLLEEKKLHPAMYMAVRKALFKPIAFFKGFLLPLAMDEECTLREALVIASILQRCHLPPVPTAVAIVKMAEQTFRGPCAVLLRVLIDKKMSLPYQAIDALVAYFHRFTFTHTPGTDVLPVLWHQTLLSFVQRYKMDLTEEQRNLLMQVCSLHFHYLISPEVKRELVLSSNASRRN